MTTALITPEITLENPDSWADLYSLIDCCYFIQLDDEEYVVFNFKVPEEYTSTTKTLLRRILREIKRKITLIESTMMESNFELIKEDVHTNITKKEWEAAKKIFMDSRDYEYEEEFIDDSEDSHRDESEDSCDDEPSPQTAV